MSVPVLEAPAAMPTVQCTVECAELGECTRCYEPLACEHVDGYGPVGCHDGEVCHDCHVANCKLRECWDDPDSAWDSRHE